MLILIGPTFASGDLDLDFVRLLSALMVAKSVELIMPNIVSDVAACVWHKSGSELLILFFIVGSLLMFESFLSEVISRLFEGGSIRREPAFRGWFVGLHSFD